MHLLFLMNFIILIKSNLKIILFKNQGINEKVRYDIYLKIN